MTPIPHRDSFSSWYGASGTHSVVFCVYGAGMGDSCCSMGSLGVVKKQIEDELGVFVYSIATGEGEYKDIWSSFYGALPAAMQA